MVGGGNAPGYGCDCDEKKKEGARGGIRVSHGKGEKARPIREVGKEEEKRSKFLHVEGEI